MNSNTRTYLIHASLFVATFFTTTWMGGEWTYGRSVFFNDDYTWADFWSGLEFSIPFLLFLTAHEFGHYFTAIYHRVKTSLPYYIPFIPFWPSIGTMGAVIRIKEQVKSKKQHFDIGIAGPIAGFIVALGLLAYGFTHLPPQEYIYEIHPEYAASGFDYDQYLMESDSFPKLTIGKNLTFLFFEKYVASDPSLVPHVNELMHYPYLFSGLLALLFTALNLMPIGQLDGGHVIYGLFGVKKHGMISGVFFVIFITYSGFGLVTPYDSKGQLLYAIPLYVGFLYILLRALKQSSRDTLMIALIVFTFQFLGVMLFPKVQGYSPWLFFIFIISRLVGVQHPPSQVEEELDLKRKILGWIALLIFVLSVSPQPFLLE